MKAFPLLPPILLAHALTVPAISGPADAAAPAPPVEELAALALERSPAVAALEARLRAAREMVGPAGALPAPMAELMIQDVSFPKYTVGSEEMSMAGPEVRQTFPFPGKREARRVVARAAAAVHGDELALLRRRLVADVRSLYAGLFALDEERTALAAARELLDMLAATAAGRYAVGEAEQQAVIKTQLELTRLDERSDDLEAERSALVAALNRLLDRPGAAPLGRVTALPRVEVPPEPWEDVVLASSAAVAIQRTAVALAERRLDVARLDLKADITAGAAIGLRGGFDPVVTLRLGLELPLWRKEKQEPMIRAAEHEVAMARAELREAEATARAKAARVLADWRRADKQVVRYAQAILPQSSAAVDAARASYLAGRGDFSTVVEHFRIWLEARSERARREADRFVAWAELDALIHDQGREGVALRPSSDSHKTSAALHESEPATGRPCPSSGRELRGGQ